MKLLYQTHSPYARKVLVAAHETGQADDLEVVHHETSPLLVNDEVFGLNPLGKVPVLVCDDGLVLFDSNVICEYLDGRHARDRLIPDDPRRRWRALRAQAIAQGIADAGIAVRWESERRPEPLRWRSPPRPPPPPADSGCATAGSGSGRDAPAHCAAPAGIR